MIYLTNALSNHSTTLADIYNTYDEYSSRRYSQEENASKSRDVDRNRNNIQTTATH